MTRITHICDGYECWKTNDWYEIQKINEDVARKVIELEYCNKDARVEDLHLCKGCINTILREFPFIFKIENETLCLKMKPCTRKEEEE